MTASRTQSDTLIDAAREVRAGEAFDVEALSRFLSEHVEGYRPPLAVRQFPAGHSNLTYALRHGTPEDGGELVLRRPPFGAEKIAKGHDMGREHRILTGIRRVWDKVPRPLVYTEDTSIIGAPFYVMERLRGVILRGRRPKTADGQPMPGLTPEVVRGVSEALVDTLVEIHGLDVDAAGLDTLGRPDGYLDRQVAGWTTRHQNAKTDDIPAVEVVARWLAEHKPAHSDATLVHNDFKYDNAVLDPTDLTRVIGVLDWELATVGDPMMDLGTTLAYWVEPNDPPELHAMPMGPTELPGNLTRVEVAERYARKTGRSLDDLLFHYVFALFKVAGIGQQIYYRFAQGDTKDPRFAHLIIGVRALAETAQRAIEHGTIEPTS